LQAENFQNSSELHGKYLRFWTQISWKCAQNIFCEVSRWKPPKCVRTSRQAASFLHAKIVKMRPKHFCKLWRRITQKMHLNVTANIFVVRRKNWETAPRSSLQTLQADNFQNATERSMLWPENGFNRENMSRTSLKKYWNWVLLNFLQWRKLRPKYASANFQNFCRLASKKSAESAVFFGLEGTLVDSGRFSAVAVSNKRMAAHN